MERLRLIHFRELDKENSHFTLLFLKQAVCGQDQLLISLSINSVHSNQMVCVKVFRHATDNCNEVVAMRMVQDIC